LQRGKLWGDCAAHLAEFSGSQLAVAIESRITKN